MSYDISAGLSSFTDCGAWAVAISCGSDNCETIQGVVIDTLDSIRERRVPESTLKEGKTRLLGRIALSSDNSLYRAEVLTNAVLDELRIDPVAAQEAAIREVTQESVARAASLILDSLISVFR